MKGSLFIISSPSGGGKGTIIRRVMDGVESLVYSVSFTTRERRENEVDGEDYNFVSREEFERLIDANEFLEYAKVHNNYYGTSRSFVDRERSRGHDVVLEIDVQGAEQVRRSAPDSIGIFILPPSYETLKARLTARETDSEAAIELRLKNAKEEVSRFREFDFVIINDDLETAVRNLESVVLANRLQRDRQDALVHDILTTFDN